MENKNPESAKEAYVTKYLTKEGIPLDPNNIRRNPGRRSIAKLMLNSFWGKLGQRANLEQAKLCYTHDDIIKLIADEAVEITGEHDTGLDCVIVNYRKKSDEDCNPGNTSAAIASFVTAYGRLKLHSLMQEIESQTNRRRLCYFDTDSVQYAHKDGDPEIATGDFLGELTDEVLGLSGDPEAKIKRAIWLGPKNYAYEIHKPDGTKVVELKSKGITLHASALEVLDFETLMNKVLNFQSNLNQEPIITPQKRFRADRNTHQIYTETFTKQVRCTLSKRWYFKDGGITLPYGYKEQDISINVFN